MTDQLESLRGKDIQELLAALQAKSPADHDGTMVIVSHQAVDDASNTIETLQSRCRDLGIANRILERNSQRYNQLLDDNQNARDLEIARRRISELEHINRMQADVIIGCNEGIEDD